MGISPIHNSRALGGTFTASLCAVLLALLALMSYWNYLVFHTLVELAGIAVAVAAFAIAWNVRRRMDNDFLLFVAMTYVAAASIDLLHTLAYEGMGVFPWATADLPTQLWIAARCLQATCLLLAPLLLRRKLPVTAAAVTLSVAVGLLLVWIFRPWPWLPSFPVCFNGSLTTFKIVAEYVISIIMLAATAFLWLRRKWLDRTVFLCISGSFLLTTGAELAFTDYVNVYGQANLIGHLLRLAAAFLAYKALVEAGLTRPFDVLFGDLNRAKERLEMAQKAGRVGTFEWDLAERDVVWTEGMQEVYGDEAATGIHSLEAWRQRVHPDDLPRVTKELNAALSGTAGYDTEYRILMSDGGIRWVWARGEVERRSNSHSLRMTGLNMDITARKKAEDALRRAKDELEQRVEERTAELQVRAQQLAHLASELTLTEQRERRRIAEVLHDHLQQLLVAAKMHTEIVRIQCPEPQRDELTFVHQVISEAIDASRSLSRELSPAVLRQSELLEACRWLVSWMAEKHRLEVMLDAEGDFRVEREDHRILIFQSLRELLFNVVKHSGVSKACLTVARQNGNLVITVSDLGVGFYSGDLEGGTKRAATGLGLLSIRERLALLGGRLEVESAPGRGARLTIVMPMGSG
jgi:signal transduction histidine kinase